MMCIAAVGFRCWFQVADVLANRASRRMASRHFLLFGSPVDGCLISSMESHGEDGWRAAVDSRAASHRVGLAFLQYLLEFTSYFGRLVSGEVS